MPGPYDNDKAKRHTERRPQIRTWATAEQLKEAVEELLKSGYTKQEIADRIKKPVSYVEGLLR